MWGLVFDVDFGIGTPSKPEVSSDILNGVSQAELQRGFNVKYQIKPFMLLIWFAAFLTASGGLLRLFLRR